MDITTAKRLFWEAYNWTALDNTEWAPEDSELRTITREQYGHAHASLIDRVCADIFRTIAEEVMLREQAIAAVNRAIADEEAAKEKVVEMAVATFSYFKDKTCEETTGTIGENYIRCGRQAVAIIKHRGRDEGPYFMCGPCASHNVQNRNAVALFVRQGDERWVQ